MEYVSLISGETFHINEFEKKTNKQPPYYQTGGKYALCPWCKSSVQIIGGLNNSTHSRTRKMYAAHTPNETTKLNFDNEAKFECVNYKGNDNNWQKIYTISKTEQKNQELVDFIENNIDQIAKDVGNILGFKFILDSGKRSKVFDKVYESFKKNGGLRVPNFTPEYIPRMIAIKADPVSCWGLIPYEKTLKRILESSKLKESMEGNQIKPTDTVKVICVLDDDEHPKHLKTRLIFEDNTPVLDIQNISAKVSQYD
ncbi:hypothetical protein [Ligilactobacillus murinus]|uniref:hypothetical protein n=2 Tax=Ligilactobacillus murinus TaxID=1622 RepID=UPI00399D7493